MTLLTDSGSTLTFSASLNTRPEPSGQSLKMAQLLHTRVRFSSGLHLHHLNDLSIPAGTVISEATGR